MRRRGTSFALETRNSRARLCCRTGAQRPQESRVGVVPRDSPDSVPILDARAGDVVMAIGVGVGYTRIVTGSETEGRGA